MEIRRRIIPAFDFITVHPSSLTFSAGTVNNSTTIENGSVVDYDGMVTVNDNTYYTINGSAAYGTRSAIVNFSTSDPNTIIQFSLYGESYSDSYLCIGALDSESIDSAVYKTNDGTYVNYNMTIPEAGNHFVKVFYKCGSTGHSGACGRFRLLPFNIKHYTISAPSSQSIEINADYPWEITGVPSWMTLSQSSGSAGKVTVNITVDANINDTRSVVLTLSCNYKDYFVSITQNTVGSIYININRKLWHFVDKTISGGLFKSLINSIGNKNNPTVTLPSDPKVASYSKTTQLNNAEVSISNPTCTVNDESKCTSKECASNTVTSKSDNISISIDGASDNIDIMMESHKCSCDCVTFCTSKQFICECDDDDACGSHCPSEEWCHCNARQIKTCTCNSKGPTCSCNGGVCSNDCSDSCYCNNDTCRWNCDCQSVCSCNNDKTCTSNCPLNCDAYSTCTSNCSCKNVCSCDDDTCEKNCDCQSVCSCNGDKICTSNCTSNCDKYSTCDCNTHSACTCDDDTSCSLHCPGHCSNCTTNTPSASQSGVEGCDCDGKVSYDLGYKYECMCQSRYFTTSACYTDRRCGCNIDGTSGECSGNTCPCNSYFRCDCDNVVSCSPHIMCECDTKNTCGSKGTCTSNCSCQNVCSCDDDTCPSDCSCQSVCSCNDDKTCTSNCPSNCDEYSTCECNTHSACKCDDDTCEKNCDCQSVCSCNNDKTCTSNCTSNCDDYEWCSCNTYSVCSSEGYCSCNIQCPSNSCSCDTQGCGCQSKTTCDCNAFRCSETYCSCNGYTAV